MPYTLLLADDSVTIQRLVELTFANEDVTVVVVDDGDQAIMTLAGRKPDIVLADVAMPGTDGYELTRHIRSSSNLSHVPVLLLTGAFEPVDHARARDVGADGVLAKPLDPQALVARVKELLARRSVTEAPAPPAPRPVEAERLDDYFAELDQAISARAAVPATAALETSVTVVETSPDIPADPPGPLLAGAFSALLAAEQSGAAPDAFAEWLPEEPAPVTTTTAAALTDEAIDRIVERVLLRLSDRVVRDTVREAVGAITSTTAERLVREEIERIKSHIK